MTVAILGAGPAGLMAAHAAVLSGHEVDIFSKKRKSYMRGAQYLHLPIPETDSKPFKLSYRLTGEVDGYRDKVYGAESGVEVSPGYLVGTSTVWDIRSVYDHLWAMYSRLVKDVEVSAAFAETLFDRYDQVVSTIPRTALCSQAEHVFSMKCVYVTEEYRWMGDNVVMCSGHEDDPWYRTSSVHGWTNTEYPTYEASAKDNAVGSKVHCVTKPISTNCTCTPGVLFAGRYGTWTKGVLAHSAFYDTIHMLEHGRAKEQNQ